MAGASSEEKQKRWRVTPARRAPRRAHRAHATARPRPRRALGWHLKAEHERVQLDAQQWKAHGEELKAAAEAKEAEWAAAEAGAKQQLEAVQVRNGVGEEG